MTTATLRISVNDKTARFLDSSSVDSRKKIATIVSVIVSEYATSKKKLSGIMDSVGTKAKSKGLTSAKLETMLNVAK